MTYSEMHDRLLAWASAEQRTDALLAARKAWFERFGEPHEEDRSYETRMNGLLDFYLYDFRPDGASTTLELFLRAGGGGLPPEELERFRELGGNVHGLFEVRRLDPGRVKLRDVFTHLDHVVTERRAMPGVSKSDLMDARLVPVDGALVFSGAFIYHPPEARRAILAEVKRLRKAAGRRGALDPTDFLARLSRMAFKLERYRNVKVESIYDFSEAGPAAGR